MIPLGVLGSAHHSAPTGGGGFAFIGGRVFGHTTAAKTVTIPSVPLGPDFPGRQVLIVIMASTSSAVGDVTSLTVGGVPFAVDATSGIERYVVALARGVVDGTTATVVVTAGESTNSFYAASSLAVYSLPPAVAPVYTAGGSGTVPVYLTTTAGGFTVAGHTRLTGPISGYAAPFTTDYNDADLRFAASVLGDVGDVDLSPNKAGNVAYTRVAGVTYA